MCSLQAGSTEGWQEWKREQTKLFFQLSTCPTLVSLLQGGVCMRHHHLCIAPGHQPPRLPRPCRLRWHRQHQHDAWLSLLALTIWHVPPPEQQVPAAQDGRPNRLEARISSTLPSLPYGLLDLAEPCCRDNAISVPAFWMLISAMHSISKQPYNQASGPCSATTLMQQCTHHL